MKKLLLATIVLTLTACANNPTRLTDEFGHKHSYDNGLTRAQKHYVARPSEWHHSRQERLANDKAKCRAKAFKWYEASPIFSGYKEGWTWYTKKHVSAKYRKCMSMEGYVN